MLHTARICICMCGHGERFSRRTGRVRHSNRKRRRGGCILYRRLRKTSTSTLALDRCNQREVQRVQAACHARGLDSCQAGVTPSNGRDDPMATHVASRLRLRIPAPSHDVDDAICEICAIANAGGNFSTGKKWRLGIWIISKDISNKKIHRCCIETLAVNVDSV